MHLLQLGRISYAEGLRIQAEVVAARKAGTIGDTLILLEHPPVLTLGQLARYARPLPPAQTGAPTADAAAA